jgi:hypothetical protein
MKKKIGYVLMINQEYEGLETLNEPSHLYKTKSGAENRAKKVEEIRKRKSESVEIIEVEY